MKTSGRRVAAHLLGLVLVGALMGCGPGEDQDRPADAGASESAATATPPAPSPPVTPPSEGSAPPPPPASIAIASLDLDEELIDLGIDDGGTLEVPEDPDRVGWFTGGGRPGGTGPTVVVGHLDSTEGAAVFSRLPELAPGDEVTVADASGRDTSYRVTETADVPQVPFPTEQVFGATPGDTLRLITCTGPYDDAAGRYTENRIVTAVARG